MGITRFQAMLHEKKKRQKKERNKCHLQWQIVHIQILVLINSRVERTHPSRQIARRARTEEVPALWGNSHILATRGLVLDLPLGTRLAVIQFSSGRLKGAYCHSRPEPADSTQAKSHRNTQTATPTDKHSTCPDSWRSSCTIVSDSLPGW